MLDKIFKLAERPSVREIRLRVGQPTRIYDNGWKYLCASGVENVPVNALRPTLQEIEELVYSACEKSVYAYNEQILGGYLSIEKGIRFGICGKVICEKNLPIAIREFSSLTLRVPHEVKNCAKAVFQQISQPLQNCLVISPPACGKTTFIRDMARLLGLYGYNCLICDERNEIASCVKGVSSYELPNCDIYSGGNKKFCFSVGLRSCAPDVIVCDEIQLHEKEELAQASSGGVKVIGTMHGESSKDVKQKGLGEYFDKFIFLSPKKIGEVVAVLGKNEL